MDNETDKPSLRKRDKDGDKRHLNPKQEGHTGVLVYLEPTSN